MKKLLKFSKYSSISILGFYLFCLFLVFLFTAQLEYNILYWKEMAKVLFSFFLFLSLLFSLISALDKEKEDEDIVCACPYCDKEMIVKKNIDNGENSSNSSMTYLAVGLATGIALS